MRRLLSIVLVTLSLLTAASDSARAQSRQPSAELQGLQEISTNFYKAGDYAGAMEAAERALALTIREFGAEHERTGIQTYSLGYIAEAAGKLGEAERYYRQSVAVREKAYGVDSAGTAQAVEKLGGVILRAGRTAEAEALFKRVLKVRGDLVGSQHAFTAGPRADLGAVALAQGNFTAALTNFRDAVRLLTTQRVEQTLARSVVDDEIRRHLPAFAGLAHAAWAASAQTGAGRSEAMAEAYAASQQAWSTSAASALARMSARLGSGDTDLGRRIRRSQDMSEKVLALHDEDMKALAAWSAVQRADAAYSSILDEFRQASIAQARDNAPAIAKQKALVEQLQAHLLLCPPGQKKTGCDDREREAITREMGTLSASMAKGSGDLMAINQRMQMAEAKLPGALEFNARRKARIDESQKLEQSIATERGEIVRLFPDYVALTEPKPITIADTQALLGADEAVVTILVGEDKSFVWAVARDRADWAMIDAGRTRLGQEVEALRRGLDPSAGEAVSGDFDLGRAHALYNLILAPVGSVIEGRRHLVVVPTGPLTSLPFQVLVAAPPTASGDVPRQMRTAAWLIRRHALSVLPSVQSLAALRRMAPAAAPPKPFLGVGDPVLVGPPANSPQARGKSVAVRPAAVYRNGHADLRAVREMAPLPETALEVKAIAQLLKAGPDGLLLGTAATESRLKSIDLRNYRVLHFATHGLVSGELDGNNEPALVLSPPDQPSELDDGLLTASEVAGLSLAADWVVLSACNTAAGSGEGADALSGLARAFFYAGARGLLVSHWPVNSRAAVELTTRTFARLAADPRMGRAEAMRQTMLDFVEAGSPPTFWAPFVLVGEGAR